jgi:hypothetical protein
MCCCCEHRTSDHRSLDFEALLSDPMTRLLMESDGVSVQDLVQIFEDVRDAIARREAVLGVPVPV